MLKTKNLLYLGLIHGMINIFFDLDAVLRKQVTPKYVDDWQGIIKSILTTAIILSPLLIIGIVIIKKMQAKRINENKLTPVQNRVHSTDFNQGIM